MPALAAPPAHAARCALAGGCHARRTAPQQPPAALPKASRRRHCSRGCAQRTVCAHVRDEAGRNIPGPAPMLPASMAPRWLPAAPALGTAPVRSWSPTALAFLGDSIWELYARRYYFAPARLHAVYVAKVTACTRAEAQAAALAALVAGGALREPELAVLKWGRNAQAGRVPERLRTQASVYRDATALEVLVGYLYVSDAARLDHLMAAVGWDAPPAAPAAAAGAAEANETPAADALLDEKEAELDE